MAARKAYRYEYVRRPDVKARANEISKQKSKERKHTHVRLQEHTMDELMKIISDACAVNGIDYEEVKDQYQEFMIFLHNK
jgi:hypothetical protein